MSQPETHRHDDVDLIVRGGAVYDATQGLTGAIADVAIHAGRVTEIGAALPARGRQEIDAAGSLVVPGLVDMHTHIYEGVCKVGLNPTEAHYDRGVVAAADGGTAGSSNFKGFREFIVKPAPFRVLSFLNVSVLGLIDQRFGELVRPEAFIPEEIVEAVEANRDIIKGLKIRLSHDIVLPPDMLEVLDKSVAVAVELGIPLMAHIGHTEQEITPIVERLAPGHIVTHCYTGKGNGILEDGKVSASVRAARERGVIFDIGHGTTQMTYGIATAAIEQGFPPDTISSDLSMNNWYGPAFDLATVLSKMVGLGMSLADAITATSTTPARILGIREEGFGALTPGQPAYLTVLRPDEGTTDLPDSAGTRLPIARLEPVLSVSRGAVHTSSPWRGDGGPS